ncbi:MAG: hypothetical protein R3Y13_01615 [bacterium]
MQGNNNYGYALCPLDVSSVILSSNQRKRIHRIKYCDKLKMVGIWKSGLVEKQTFSQPSSMSNISNFDNEFNREIDTRMEVQSAVSMPITEEPVLSPVDNLKGKIIFKTEKDLRPFAMSGAALAMLVEGAKKKNPKIEVGRSR